MRLLGTFVIVLSMAFGLVQRADAQCLAADQDEYAEGGLAQHVFHDAAGRPEPSFILTLSEPVCLTGQDETDNVGSVRTMQVYGTDETVERSISRRVGQRVRVLGRPFGAMTVHHHAPVVMEVSRIWTIQVESRDDRRIVEPQRGSSLRAELLDAARPVFEDETDGPVEFVVKRLAVTGDWAFGEVRLQRPGGRSIDWSRTKYAEDFADGMFDPSGSFFLLHRTGRNWAITEFATGPTDVAWDSWRQDHHLPLALFQR